METDNKNRNNELDFLLMRDVRTALLKEASPEPDVDAEWEKFIYIKIKFIRIE